MTEQITELETIISQLINSGQGTRGFWLLRPFQGDLHKFLVYGDAIVKWGQTIDNEVNKDFAINVRPPTSNYTGFGFLKAEGSDRTFQMRVHQQPNKALVYRYQIDLPSTHYWFQHIEHGVRTINSTPREGRASAIHLAATTDLINSLVPSSRRR